MTAIERILCPVDFSEYSSRALAYAVAMAEWYQARVTALHVFPIPPVVDVIPAIGVGPMPALAFSEEDRQAVLARLEEVMPSAARDPRVEFRVEQSSDVRREILDQAHAMKADLMVVGSHGRSGFQHMLLGSTTERILRKAECPVLVVPRHVGEAEIATPSMPFRRIVCPVDFSETSVHALEYALRLAEEADATLLLLHVIEMPPELDDMLDVLTREVTDIRAEAETKALQRLRTLIPVAAREYCTVSTSVVEGSAHREIVRAAGGLHADLIVMGVHGRGAVDLKLFGSNTHAVLRTATCPVMVVHFGKT